MNEKKDKYLERVLNVERQPSPWLYFSHLEVCRRSANNLANLIANLIARKSKETYCDVVGHVKTRIRFTMLRTTLIASCGYRGKKIDLNKHVSHNLALVPMME